MTFKIYVNKMKDSDKLLALASLVINDDEKGISFKVNDIRIMDGDNGPWVAFPSRKKNNGEYQDVAHPNNGETRTQLVQMILDEYNSKSE